MNTKNARVHGRFTGWWQGIALALLLGWGGREAHGGTLYIDVVPNSGAGSATISGLPGVGFGITETNLTSTSTVLQVVAKAATGYGFAYWTLSDGVRVVNRTTNDATAYFSINDTNAIAFLGAVFVPLYRNLTLSVSPPGAGDIKPLIGTTNYPVGQDVAIEAIPTNTLPYYIFDGWSGSAFSSNRQFTFKMPDVDMSLIANFKAVWPITLTNYYGPVGQPPFVVYATNGQSVTVGIDRSPVYYDDYRFRIIGWVNGLNNIPPSNSGVSNCFIMAVTTNSSLEWSWRAQYRVTVFPYPGNVSGTLTEFVNDGDMLDGWIDSNQSARVTLRSFTNALAPDSCIINGVIWPVDANGGVTFPVTTNTDVTLVFRETVEQQIPSWYMKKFGLLSNAGGANSEDADPDEDGLTTMEEYRLSSSNSLSYYNPVSADSDSDGMDDYYETYSIDPTNLTVQEASRYIRAAADNGSKSLGNGRTGNPDGDYQWDTTSGYEDEGLPLTNYKEWVGPDRIPPYIFVTLTNGMTVTTNGVTVVYPFGTNPSSNRPPLKVRVAVPGDTDDQSKGNTSDTDGDKFDDGFEYTWDQWQLDNQGTEEVFLVGVTNGVAVIITNTVPAWDGAVNFTRRFNPNNEHAGPTSGGADYDILYDYVTGGVSPYWYNDTREYNAWQPTAFSQTVPAAPHSIRMDFPPPDDPDPKRCSHPFLKDVDGDGLPDGWEVTFGYDPWASVTFGHTVLDGTDNPDDDWMARLGTNDDWAAISAGAPLDLRNHEVYVATNFNPYTAWARVYPTAQNMPGPGGTRSPNTERYANIEEIRGPDGLIGMVPSQAGDDGTSPILVDTDTDGIWDGWENYVGLNPKSRFDGSGSGDGDKLSNLDEFRSFVTSSTNRQALTPLPEWNNKIFPTDPNDPDTDGDSILDAGERPPFNGANAALTVTTNFVWDATASNYVAQVFVSGTWNGRSYTQGGLNPNSADTDGDSMPDPFEIQYGTALNGTMSDAFEDPDGDRLQNYQEYISACVYHWHYDAWVMHGPGLYNSGDFFVGVPKFWDWSQSRYITDGLFVPYTDEESDSTNTIGARVVSCNPGLPDSDNDGMDDYWEVYHGLNPLYGGRDGFDLVDPGFRSGDIYELGDPRDWPYITGSSYSDSDGDGLPNFTEAINTLYEVPSPTYHTDPSPLWMTDMEYADSWVNLYYRPGIIADTGANAWYWGAAPDYIFSFESNEGYDTDGDAFSDHEELIESKTDPLTPERPVRRRALYLPPGSGAYARTFPGYAPGTDVPSGGYLPGIFQPFNYSNEVFRSFTVEAWIRPVNPTSGVDQVIVSRPLEIPIANPAVGTDMVANLLNFQLGISGDGLPYVAYHGDGLEHFFRHAEAPGTARLSASNWTHIAGTYQVAANTNASQGGKLSLYINGVLVSQQTFSELPVIGRTTVGPPSTIFGAPIVVGARDFNPNGEISGNGASAPDPDYFFEGWVDEVRVWNGARSPSEITAAMRTRMKQADVLANVGRTNSLYYLYSFDALADPDPGHSPTWPGKGFGETADLIFPAGWEVGFWGSSPVQSTIYADYRFIPWIQNAVTHLPEVPAVDVGDPGAMVVTGSGTNAVTNGVAFWNTTNPYGYRYMTAPSFVAQRYEISSDLLPLGEAQGDEDIPMWDGGGTPTNQTYDSDGDGLPDQWEELHGLDPLDPNGANGANGDPDGDGLNNLAELLAGTDPVVSDTDGDGFNDYYSWTNPVYRTFGEIYTDHDGLPDVWEMEYGLNTRIYDAYGIYGDPDNDGWSNFTEYMKDTDPSQVGNHPDPTVNGLIKYNGLIATGSVIVLGYQTNSMDGAPIVGRSGGGVIRRQTEVLGSGDGSTKLYSGTLLHGSIVRGSVRVRRLNPAWVTPDFDFTDNADGVWTFFPDYFTSVPAGTNVVFDYGTGTYTFNWPNIGFQGPWAQDTIFIDYDWRDGDPNSFDMNGLKEGDLYIFAFRDVNGNRLWDRGEPAGMAESQPIHIGWENIHGVVVGLTDSPPPGHGRFRWPAVTNASSYTITLRNLSTNGAPQIFRRTIRAPQTTFHEGHFDAMGIWDLPMATYQWAALGINDAFITNGTFEVIYPATQVKPVLVSPAGSTISYAFPEFIWTMDASADRFTIQIASDSAFSNKVYETMDKAPFREANGTYWYNPRIFAGDLPLTNGLYYWRIKGMNADHTSDWSTPTAFLVSLQPPPVGPAMISGNIVYFGKASGTNDLTRLTVQAYDNGGFGGRPLAQRVYSHVCNTNSLPLFDKGSYELMGLPPGTYYVRIFHDVNTNGLADVWETQGFLADAAGRPRGVLLGTHTAAMYADVILNDRDIDSDGLPDAWEWYFYGNLQKTGYDVVPNSTNTLATKYAESYFDSSPTLMDSDGDGLWDGWHDDNHNGVWDPGEAPGEQGDGVHPQSSYGTIWNNADSDGDGLSDGYEIVNGLNPLKAGEDRDGDGMSDANEVLHAKTSPWLNTDVLRITGVAPRLPGQALTISWPGKAGVGYQIQVSRDLKTWSNASGGSFSDAGPHVYSDDTSSVTTLYYRVLVR